MLVDIYAWISLSLAIIIMICIYYYSLTTYGLKVTVLTTGILTSFVLVGIICGWYAAVDLYTYPPFTGVLNGTPFLISDPFSIFPSFLLIFELARFSLNLMKGASLSNKDILSVGLLTSFYGFCHQILIDTASGAVGYYYIQNPPPVNIFGFPIVFLLAFTFYGVWGAIFLIIERRYHQGGD